MNALPTAGGTVATLEPFLAACSPLAHSCRPQTWRAPLYRALPLFHPSRNAFPNQPAGLDRGPWRPVTVSKVSSGHLRTFFHLTVFPLRTLCDPRGRPHASARLSCCIVVPAFPASCLPSISWATTPPSPRTPRLPSERPTPWTIWRAGATARSQASPFRQMTRPAGDRLLEDAKPQTRMSRRQWTSTASLRRKRIHCPRSAPSSGASTLLQSSLATHFMYYLSAQYWRSRSSCPPWTTRRVMQTASLCPAGG